MEKTQHEVTRHSTNIELQSNTKYNDSTVKGEALHTVSGPNPISLLFVLPQPVHPAHPQ